ncbi:DUF692 domain-containing protein [Aliikangiella coralliicola]|uniref:DUF692 domain-containing protein n=1 Tax=Aliikangiella coralliicola TaxID=2592383 RepID=A0A545UCX8_9GAMM|nr:DUF692 domain-containing protein [Aliikangiella coralliicola]TQV87319.1 DUF692 domain-containing protein [Aliikangiella coralliicola]
MKIAIDSRKQDEFNESLPMSSRYLANSIASGSVGLGLREVHINQIIHQEHPVPWFELLVDNWFARGGFVNAALIGIAERYPLTLHGVGLSLGSVNPLNWDYLAKVKYVLETTNACWYSEHCSFSSFANQQVPDLLPIPYTEEALNHLASRISQVQDYLQQPILIENASSYIQCSSNEMSEPTFLKQLVELTGCYLLLDINNVYVSSQNHGWCAHRYLEEIPNDKVREIHLGGYYQHHSVLIDSHSCAPSDSVWALYQYYLANFRNDVPTLIEWDNDLPTFSALVAIQQKALGMIKQAQSKVEPKICD